MTSHPAPCSKLYLAFPLLSLLLIVAGCDGSEGPVFDGDGGGDAGPEDAATDTGAPDAGPDADAAVDDVPPRLLGTTPADGAEGIPTDQALELEFSEAMTPELGSVRVEPVGATLFAADGEWNDAGDILTLAPETGWPSGASLTVTVQDSFADLAGNPLEAPATFGFTTVDLQAPFVRVTFPEEGATGVSARLEEVQVQFSEPMNATAGSLVFDSGPGSAGPARWTAEDTVAFDLTGLAYETDYALALEGFEDPAGNALDGAPVLGDGALDFSTGVDDDPPYVAMATPDEGATGVGLDTTSVVLTFVEPMDESVGTATLEGPGGSTDLSGTWSAGGTVLTLDITGLLTESGADYRVVLSGFVDLAGNALDPAPLLGDGALDFTAGPDTAPPVAVDSTPAEGEGGVSTDFVEVTVTFSEPMDTSIDEAVLAGGTSSYTVPVRWSSAGTIATIIVTDLLEASTAYEIDLTGFVDAAGTALDATDAYLGDGVLDFETAPPNGEDCRSPLTAAQAVDTGDGLEWTIPRNSVEAHDHPDICGLGEGSADAVIQYEKTSDSSVLMVEGHVDVPETYRTMGFMIQSGACDGSDPAAVVEQCTAAAHDWNLYAEDLPAGTYWIWVYRPSFSSDVDQTPFRMTVREIPAAPKGETCSDPLTSADVTAGDGSSGNPWTWRIEPPAAGDRAYMSHDMSILPGVDQFACASDLPGADAVIEVPKASADSVLQVDLNVESDPADDTSLLLTRFLDVEVTDSCANPRESLRCLDRVENGTTYVSAPAGNVYLWLAGEDDQRIWPLYPVEVQVTEIPTSQGDTCAQGYPLSEGTNTVQNTSTTRIEPPEQIASPTPVEWYRFTPATTSVVTFAGDAAAGGALVDPETGDSIATSSDLAGNPLGSILPAGEPACVAVPADGSLSTIDVSTVVYDGVGGTVEDLELEFPPNSIGSCTTNLGSDYWMRVTPTTLYMGISGLTLEAPRSGHTYFAARSDGEFSDSPGGDHDLAAATVGEMLFASWDDYYTGTGDPRIYLLWDGSSPTWNVAPWDEGSMNPSDEVQAMAYDGTDLVYVSREEPSLFFTLSPMTSGSEAVLGTSTKVTDIIGMAADDEYLYLAGYAGGVQGIYRLDRALLAAGSDPDPVTLAQASDATFLLSGSSPTSAPSSGPDPTNMAVDDYTDPQHLYFRAREPGHVFAIIEPDGASPINVGAISDIGETDDVAMGFDVDTDELFLFSTEDVECGRVVRLAK